MASTAVTLRDRQAPSAQRAQPPLWSATWSPVRLPAPAPERSFCVSSCSCWPPGGCGAGAGGQLCCSHICRAQLGHPAGYACAAAARATRRRARGWCRPFGERCANASPMLSVRRVPCSSGASRPPLVPGDSSLDHAYGERIAVLALGSRKVCRPTVAVGKAASCWRRIDGVRTESACRGGPGLVAGLPRGRIAVGSWAARFAAFIRSGGL